MDLRKVYTYALRREEEGKRFFEENATRVQHAAASGAFRALAAEEQKHIEFIQSLLSALETGRASDLAMGAVLTQSGVFAQRAQSELLDQKILEAMTPDLPVLRTAYLIERDFADFYAEAAQQAEGEARRALEMLCQWERGHEALFREMHDKAFEIYAHMPWGG